MKRTFAILLAAALIAGCSHHIGGPKRVLKPEGEAITLSTAAGATLAGEFLGVCDGDLIVLNGVRLVALPLGSLSSVDVEGYRTVKVSDRTTLLLYARYPQGLTAEQWREVLRERGQPAFDRIPAL